MTTCSDGSRDDWDQAADAAWHTYNTSAVAGTGWWEASNSRTQSCHGGNADTGECDLSNRNTQWTTGSSDGHWGGWHGSARHSTDDGGLQAWVTPTQFGDYGAWTQDDILQFEIYRKEKELDRLKAMRSTNAQLQSGSVPRAADAANQEENNRDYRSYACQPTITRRDEDPWTAGEDDRQQGDRDDQPNAQAPPSRRRNNDSWTPEADTNAWSSSSSDPSGSRAADPRDGLRSAVADLQPPPPARGIPPSQPPPPLPEQEQPVRRLPLTPPPTPLVRTQKPGHKPEYPPPPPFKSKSTATMPPPPQLEHTSADAEVRANVGTQSAPIAAAGSAASVRFPVTAEDDVTDSDIEAGIQHIGDFLRNENAAKTATPLAPAAVSAPQPAMSSDQQPQSRDQAWDVTTQAMAPPPGLSDILDDEHAALLAYVKRADVYDAAFYKGMFTDSGPTDEWWQHNGAAKYFRYTLEGTEKGGFKFHNTDFVKVKKVIHAPKGPHFEFAPGEPCTKWIWHEMIGQLDDKSIDIVCHAPLEKCEFALRASNGPHGSAPFTKDARDAR